MSAEANGTASLPGRPWRLPAVAEALRDAMRVLPGPQAQALLAPRPRRAVEPLRRPAGARQAAALVLLYPRADRPHLVLTVRAGALPQHAGQVSLPGGAMEPGEAVASAALREAAEEVGIDPSAVRVIGALTPLHIPVSDFLVHPVVGILDRAPVFTHAAEEVDRVLEVSLDDLLDPARIRTTTRMRGVEQVEVPYFAVEGEQVWGATAMMLAELLCALGARPMLEQAVRVSRGAEGNQ